MTHSVDIIRQEVLKCIGLLLPDSLNDNEEIDKALCRLDRIPSISLNILAETGCGKVVNGLKRHPLFGSKAEALVLKWRAQAEAEARATGHTIVSSSIPSGEKSRQKANVSNMKVELKEEYNDEINEEEGRKSSKDKLFNKDQEQQPVSKKVKKEFDPAGYEYKQNLQSKQINVEGNSNNGNLNNAGNTYTSNDFDPPIKRLVTVKPNKSIKSEIDPFLAALESSANDHAAAQPKKKKVPKKPPQLSAVSIFEGIQHSIAEMEKNVELNNGDNSNNAKSGSISLAEPIAKSKSRTRIYAGKRKLDSWSGIYGHEIPSLYTLCIRRASLHIDAAVDRVFPRFIPYWVIKPVLEHCSVSQLERIERKNKYLKQESDELWRRHCQREFPSETEGLSDDDIEGEKWQHIYKMLLDSRERRLQEISSRMKRTQSAAVSSESEPRVMECVAIAPSRSRRRYAYNSTEVTATLPSAAELSKSRRQIFENGDRTAYRQMSAVLHANKVGSSNLGRKLASSTNGQNVKPVIAPLMAKSLQLAKKLRKN